MPHTEIVHIIEHAEELVRHDPVYIKSSLLDSGERPVCPRCGNTTPIKDMFNQVRQEKRYRCKQCGHTFYPSKKKFIRGRKSCVINLENPCLRCGSVHVGSHGNYKNGKRFICYACGRVWIGSRGAV